VRQFLQRLSEPPEVNLEALLTEQLNPVSAHIDALPTAGVLALINQEDQKVAGAVAAEIPQIAEAVDRIVDRVRAGGRLFYIGAGTSGRLGVLDAAECPPTFHVNPDLVQGIIAGGEAALARATEASEDDPEAGRRDLASRGFTAKDALAGIAASGRTPYVLGAVQAANQLGALTIGISCTPDSPLSRAVHIAITLLAGPEVIAGSTRMKAGTATKLVLNMISTAVMIRLGYVYGNLMVNVQPRNAKLEDRARRIIAVSAAVTYERAGELLVEAGGSVPVAIVMSRRLLDRNSAETRLAAAGGRLSEALSN
jgi:N-acetylmuramic acid 6-phosphate etherase